MGTSLRAWIHRSALNLREVAPGQRHDVEAQDPRDRELGKRLPASLGNGGESMNLLHRGLVERVGVERYVPTKRLS